jgi:hypothetical protein
MYPAQHRVKVVGQQMSLFDTALSVFRKLAEHLPQMLAQIPVKHLAPELGHEKQRGICTPIWSDLGSQTRPS